LRKIAGGLTVSPDAAKTARAGRRANDEVHPHCGGKQLDADHFPEASLQSIAVHSRVSMPRDNDAGAGKGERGSARPEREVPGTYDLPL